MVLLSKVTLAVRASNRPSTVAPFCTNSARNRSVVTGTFDAWHVRHPATDDLNARIDEDAVDATHRIERAVRELAT